MVASEAHPFASTGGLGEVVGALPQALARLGHTVSLILPLYGGGRTIPWPATKAGRRPREAFVLIGDRRERVGFQHHTAAEGVGIVLVEAPEYFDRSGLYGNPDGDYPDNAVRFALFSRAALEYVRLRGVRPSLFHLHDWQTGLLPAYQKMLCSADPVVGGVPAVFTIHNLAFQGVFPAWVLEVIGLPREVLHVQAMEFWGGISCLKAGINFSERITTVSPTYAREILTPELGFGLEGVLARRAGDLRGILNGIDVNRWNPSDDPYLPERFTAEDLSGKRAARERLLDEIRVPGSNGARRRPVVGLVSRLTDQKGLDLLAAAADELMTLDVTWAMMGNGERRYEEMWTALAARYPGRVSATIGYQERLEHLIEGGADMFLMPSRFEPCGLNQLNSQRYGTIPVVRATGGLDDTVRDASEPDGTGFKFRDYTPGGLVGALRRALDAYGRPEQWQRLQRAAMQQDHSWDRSAREYVKVYEATF